MGKIVKFYEELFGLRVVTRLVAHIVKKYQNSGEETEDLISIGTIGLIKAVTTFDSDKGSRLVTYAARCVENAILS